MVAKQEVSDIISTRSYFGTLLIGFIPIIGDILLVIWSRSISVRVNKQNLCKAFLILKLALMYPSLVLTAVLGVILCN